MSELRVWVDGNERVIQGVSEETTCESIILVLAKAAEKSGKVALFEKWRAYERILPPDENPSKCVDAWGSYKDEVCLILQDEPSTSANNQLNKSLINMTADDKFDVIKTYIDSESHENLTSFQQRKLQRLARAIVILDLQDNYWHNSEESFLYLTEEEIIEDLSVKLGRALKLQAKELVEFATWKTELNKLRKVQEDLFSQHELSGEKIEDLEAQIVETTSAIERLVREIEKTRNEEEIEAVKNSRNSARILEELDIITPELAKQNILFQKQEQNLNAISSSLFELDTSLRQKSNEIKKLKNEIENNSKIYDISENFRPQIPEAESKSVSQEVNHDIGSSQDFQSDSPSLGIESGAWDNRVPSTPSSSTKSLGSGSEEVDPYLSRNLKNSVNAIMDNTSTEDSLQHSHVPRSPKNLSPSSLVYRNNSERKDDHFSESNLKNKTSLQSLKKFENGQDMIIDSISARLFRPVCPQEVSMKPPKKSTVPTVPPIPYASHLALSSSLSVSNSPQKKESFKMTKDSFEKPTMHDTHKTVTKPPTKPNPKRDHILASQLGTTTASSTRPHDLYENNKSIYSTRDNFKLISAPKPYGTQSSRFGATGKVSTHPLSYSLNSRTRVMPSAVSDQRTQSRNHKLMNSNDSTEHGVFV